MAERSSEEAALVGDTGSAPEQPLIRSRRQRLRLPLMLLGPAVLVVAGVYVYLTGGRFESTDNAYVQAARVAISANVSGRVKEVLVRDNQAVRAGDVLFRLDDAPFRIAVEEASAQLAAARLLVESTKASYQQRQAELQAASVTLAFQEHEHERQQRLLASGISSQSQVDRALLARDEARAKVSSSQQQLNAVAASLGGNPDIAAARHPSVQQMQALLDRARLNLAYATVSAPGDGVVTKVEQLQAGTYINTSAPLFALVSVGEPWIEANFKEDQLTHIRVGQAASVAIDAYPGKRFEGKVASVSPGTGSQFAVLPPENATGNWVKVVQRLPVRIELERVDPAYSLQAGLSVSVSVDTRHERRLFGFGIGERRAADTPR